MQYISYFGVRDKIYGLNTFISHKNHKNQGRCVLSELIADEEDAKGKKRVGDKNTFDMENTFEFPENMTQDDINKEIEGKYKLVLQAIHKLPDQNEIEVFYRSKKAWEYRAEYMAMMEEEKKSKTNKKAPGINEVILDDDVKHDVIQVIDFINKADKYIDIGAEIPRGFLLYGDPGCVDKDTEFFNGTEWKNISNYKEGDKVLIYHEDGTATLEYPQRYIKEPCDNLTLMSSKNGKINQCLSDEHRVIYFTKKTDKPHEIRFDEFKANPKEGVSKKFIKTSFDYEGEGIDLTNEELRVMVMVIADGTFPRDTNYCVLNLKKERKIVRAMELLNKAKIEYKKFEMSNGYVRLAFQSPRHDKVFTSEYYKANKNQMEIILDEVLYWDGNISNGRKQYNTCVKASADYIQFIACALGKYSTISIDDRRGRIREMDGKEYETKSIGYKVSISDTSTKIEMPFRKDRPSVSFTNYKTLDGYKYCFTVSTGMLVLRRNNRVFITGNCGKTLIAKAIAKECGCNFQQYTGGEMSNKYVGTGPNKIKEIFANAREQAPTIIFIDELDALCISRKDDSNNEDLKTLTQLLSEMDGMNDNEGVFVIGATNQLHLLDDAVLREGRFSRKVEIKKPSRENRVKMFELYMNKLKHEDNLDIELYANLTDDCNGAKISSICNEAAILAVDRDKTKVSHDEIMYMIDKLMAFDKEHRIKDKEERKVRIGFGV